MKWLLAFILLVPASLNAADKIWVATGNGRTSNFAEFTFTEEKKRDFGPTTRETLNFKNGAVVEVTCLEREPTRYRVRIVVSDPQGPLLTTEAEIARDSPVVIRGPLAGERGCPLIAVAIR